MDQRREIAVRDIEQFHARALEYSGSARALILSRRTAGFEVRRTGPQFRHQRGFTGGTAGARPDPGLGARHNGRRVSLTDINPAAIDGSERVMLPARAHPNHRI